jgi:hypothetical protein
MPLAIAEPIIAMPCSDSTVRTSWKSTLTRPGDRVVQHVVGRLERILLRDVLAQYFLELVVEDHDQRVDMRRQGFESLLGDLHALGALEGERLGHHRHREDAKRARHLGDHGCGAGAGATAHARRDEDHVRASDRFFDAVAIGDRDRTRFLGLRSRAQAARAELDLVVGLVAREHLRVGVDRDELHALHGLLDHVVDGVAAGAADADHLDHRPGYLTVYDFEHVVISLPLF